MKYIFKNSLFIWIQNKKISREEFIILMQNSNYEEFKGLDSITLSRWLTGKTTPPLYKQLYIAKYLEVSISDLYSTIDVNSFKIPKKIINTFSKLIKHIDFSTLSLSYNRLPEEHYCIIKNQNFEEHYKEYSDFHYNISALNVFFDELYKFKNKISYVSIALENKEKKKLAHYSGVINIDKLINIKPFNKFSSNDIFKGCLLNVGLFKSSSQYIELVDYLICYFLNHLPKHKECLYLFVASYPIFDITRNLLNVELINYYPPKNEKSKLGVYLLKIDIFKAITNPLLLTSAQKKLNCYKECSGKSCNLCNLSKINK